jgi:hypothetical protein
LIPLEEFDQPPFITPPYHDPKMKIGVLTGHLEQDLIQWISDISHHQGIQILHMFFGEHKWPGLVMLHLEPDEPIHLPFFEQLSNLFQHRLHLCSL